MNTPSSTIVQRPWNYCNVLRDGWWQLIVAETESKVEVRLARSALTQFEGIAEELGEEE